jgi:hypothetical protein
MYTIQSHPTFATHFIIPWQHGNRDNNNKSSTGSSVIAYYIPFFSITCRMVVLDTTWHSVWNTTILSKEVHPKDHLQEYHCAGARADKVCHGSQSTLCQWWVGGIYRW